MPPCNYCKRSLNRLPNIYKSRSMHPIYCCLPRLRHLAKGAGHANFSEPFRLLMCAYICSISYMARVAPPIWIFKIRPRPNNKCV